MRGSSLAALAVLVSSVLGLAACGGSPADDDETDPGDSTTFTPKECTSAPVDHSAACAEPCAIGVDVEISCDDYHYAAPGLFVAPGPETTWLVTSSEEDRMLFQAGAKGAERVADDVLPPELARETIRLALSPEGALHLAGNTAKPPDFDTGGLVHVTQAANAWAAELVPDAGGPIALDVDSKGAPHVWFMANGKAIVATRIGEDTWSKSAAPDLAGDWKQFALTSTGQPATFGFVEEGDSWQLHASYGAADHALGAGIVAGFPNGYVLAKGPSAADGPAVAVVVPHPDGLHVVWTKDSMSEEVTLPDTPWLEPKCSTLASECDTTCEEKSTGVLEDSVALARTDDGALWVVYVETDIDIEVHYAGGCDNPNDCGCAANVDSDQGQSTLHVVRVLTDGSPPKEALTLPMSRFAVEGGFQTVIDYARHAIDARGFGKDIAIGLATTDAPSAPVITARTRLLRIDTSKLLQ